MSSHTYAWAWTQNNYGWQVEVELEISHACYIQTLLSVIAAIVTLLLNISKSFLLLISFPDC
jgi:hypothetical protein